MQFWRQMSAKGMKSHTIQIEDQTMPMNRKTLNDLRKMKEQGETLPSVDAGDAPDLPEGFWEDAAMVNHTAMPNPQDLLRLLHGEFTSLHIGFNDHHASNYATAQRFHDEWGMYGGGADNCSIEWASEEERQKALRENSVWTIQWYPETPVGFHCVGASTFEAAARFALEFGKEG